MPEPGFNLITGKKENRTNYYLNPSKLYEMEHKIRLHE
jgi:hypothetical protein